MSDLYSPLKAAWHLDRIAALRRGEQIAPIELQFIISDLCNHDCYFCAYRAETGLSSEQFAAGSPLATRGHNNPVRLMATDKAQEILRDAVAMGTRSVIFTGGGEPTVHPDHLDLFSYALDLGLECSLNTNGALLRRGWTDVLPRFKYVRFSIDAGSAAEYARVRRVPESTYDAVLGNLEAVAEACRDSGCTVGAGYVVGPHDYEALLDGVAAIRKTGAAYVRLASVQSTEQMAIYDRETFGRIAELRARAREMAAPGFDVIDLFELALGNRPEDAFCGMQQFVVYIGANLKVYRCCYTAYTQLGEAGDLSDQSFAQWFASEQKRRAIASFDARDCAICPLEHKNRVIRYMASNEPGHVNFV